MSGVIFLGTGGGRRVVLSQLRRSGGFWLKLNGVNILQDPGPGCLVMVHKHRLKPDSLDAIILSHRHIDHSNDVNIMIEAMTKGGFQLRGRLIVPGDCLRSDPVVLKYVRPFTRITEIKEGMEIALGDIKIEFPVRNVHQVETYGAIYRFGSRQLGYIPDTEYFPQLQEAYRGVDFLIINVVRMKKDKKIHHLDIHDVEELINSIRPKMAILTHFGLQVLKASPWIQARSISERTGVEVIAAYDGLSMAFE
ncbi:metal-dependent hydrolase, beta-lactamase superfamily III [Candidatus Methanoperedens nitroreducens]|uniref:Metal-dependent hydrolase, beta-lactamase superfamily III n=1 Tax=Candidatus Methanoperedens nitratireducens TaxID=1392998 RepID=A0A062V4W8_9EURY|nr:MBL fold metallo-hydrolase [Candidatus Methanoperedens nitroreducens]KCZ71658.1 metal-dependent hydrolase, beta-lactamase superfamily III [Candidatus Methanoperedens nitroreducens]MDJ1421286.1 MBL fold metallo-hydrolase [Candidatus Methanoperedens sp.]